MDEEQRDMKARKAYYQRVDFVFNSLQGIPQLCPCGSITKEIVDEEDTYDYLPRKRYFICKDFENDGLHYRQPWVVGVQEEVERLKLKVLRHENLLTECEELKVSSYFFQYHKFGVCTIFLTHVFWFGLCLFSHRLKCW
ncbi:uncharacterized protein LOC106356669 [Brassica napus]|uniref:uncharacterized protein LOC106356669 n=1 Tax=Brassica napus TaxID=3708 RepID=UPI002079094A|nr:uncharacterized protein LOC106356669 [Brassica napus]